jgi:hypothetical protein
MPDPSQLPFLLRLLDDESPAVRAKITETLRAYGPALEAELRRLGLMPNARQAALLGELWRPERSRSLLEAWRRCLEQESGAAQLEAALALIAEYQNGPGPAPGLPELLDELADRFAASEHALDALGLNRFLFVERRLQGAETDYYNPLNSNLVRVLESGRGIPISLASVFILVGRRLGIEIHGCNVPGHFLARARVEGVDYVFDCFGGGRLITGAELEAVRRSAPEGYVEVLETPTPTLVLLGRVLRNLIQAYRQSGEPAHAELMRGLLEETQRHQRRLAEEGELPLD